MRLDRKLLLIAPAIVLLLVVAGVAYAALQLHVLASVSETLQERSAFITAVERGEKTLSPRQSAGLLRLAAEVEARRTAAITASRDLLIALSAIGLVACTVLMVAVRGVPREGAVHFARRSPQRPGDGA